MLSNFLPGLVQGIITGIRGLCNGLGPAVYGLIFSLFHVNLNEHKEKTKPVAAHPVTMLYLNFTTESTLATTTVPTRDLRTVRLSTLGRDHQVVVSWFVSL